jgi:hypothetical protein
LAWRLARDSVLYFETFHSRRSQSSEKSGNEAFRINLGVAGKELLEPFYVSVPAIPLNSGSGEFRDGLQLYRPLANACLALRGANLV